MRQCTRSIIITLTYLTLFYTLVFFTILTFLVKRHEKVLEPLNKDMGLEGPPPLPMLVLVDVETLL